MMSHRGWGTIKANENFDCERECKKLHKAMKGMGTDERVIINVLAGHDNKQRQEMKVVYKTAYGRDLEDHLKEELGGHFEDVIMGMMVPELDWDVYWLHKGMKGFGTDESTLIEMLVGKEYWRIEEYKRRYKEMFGKDLESAVKSELSGDFQRFIVGMLAAGRDEEGEVDKGRAEEDAKRLQDAEIGTGTDESEFIMIMNMRSYTQLKATFEEYQRIADQSITECIEKEFSGSMKEGLLAAVKIILDPPGYYADKLYHAMKGVGTVDKTLIRIIVGRAELDLEDIKTRYSDQYGSSLVEDIKGDTSGDYRKILLRLLGVKEK